MNVSRLTQVVPTVAVLCILLSAPALGEAQGTAPLLLAQAQTSGSFVTLEPAPIAEYWMTATRQAGGAIIFDGYAPDEATRDAFSTVSGANVRWLRLGGGAPGSYRTGAEWGLAALEHLSEGRFAMRSNVVTITGIAASVEDYESLLALAETIPAGLVLARADIMPPPDYEPVAPAAPPAAETVAAAQPPEAEAVPVAEAATPAVVDCTALLADFSARNSITFSSGAAVITPASAAALDELAADLATCREGAIHIEGHTDSDGDEQLNLALSVARAEAVVAAVIERGIEPGRLYAIGYGEAQPVAENETPTGKQLNRRIVVKIVPD